MIFSPSRVDRLRFGNRDLYVKRDDLIHPMYSGNKIRKLYALLENDSLSHLISYGGYQSNAMLSMAYFAHQKKIPFTYITKPVPDWVTGLPSGNYSEAIRLGMENIQVVHTGYDETVQNLSTRYPGATIIDQGAASPFAEAGIALLAEELNAFIDKERLHNVALLLPSGTGATSLYLAKHIAPDAAVYTTPCVGDGDYLKAQWRRLEPALSRYPTILTTGKKHHFAKPYRELLAVFKKLETTGITFDMVYAPKTWLAYFENEKLFEGKTVIYVHTGGVIGNVTQRLRYERKGMV